jgi:agmatinase
MGIIKIRLSNNINGAKECDNSPNLVLEELKKIGGNEKGVMIEYKKLNLEEIHIDSGNLKEADYLIFENSKEIFEKNFFSLFLGGDHFISYPILRAFLKIEENPLLIIFDSHSDCLNSSEIPHNRGWLRKLIEGGFNSRNVIIISPRNIFPEEMEFIFANKILLIKMDILREDTEGVCDLIMERARASSGFYVSIDIDCVDPAFAPGTNDIEPGGLTSRDLIYFIKRLKLLKNFKGADIVEINPKLDFNNITVKLGAKIVSELI